MLWEGYFGVRQRRECGVAALGGFLYAVGGVHPDAGPLRTVERYDPAADARINCLSRRPSNASVWVSLLTIGNPCFV